MAQEIARSTPDPFPRMGVGSGYETINSSVVVYVRTRTRTQYVQSRGEAGYNHVKG